MDVICLYYFLDFVDFFEEKWYQGGFFLCCDCVVDFGKGFDVVWVVVWW